VAGSALSETLVHQAVDTVVHQYSVGYVGWLLGLLIS
jgi:hypothetical protein